MLYMTIYIYIYIYISVENKIFIHIFKSLILFIYRLVNTLDFVK